MAFTAEQQRNAAAIIKVGRELGASERDIQIALAVALQESSLRILNYGDKAGPDSRGLFQQRTWWGPLSVRMDAEGSARLFFQGGQDGSPGLLDIKNRNNMSIGDVAYAVQKFRKEYKPRYETAAKTVAPLMGLKSAPSAPPSGATPPKGTTTPIQGGVQGTATPAAPDPKAGWVRTPSGQHFPDFDDDGRADDFVPDEDMGDQDFDIARIKSMTNAFMDQKRAAHAARFGGSGRDSFELAPGVVPGGASGGGGSNLSPEEAAARFGYAVAFFQSVPELYQLFQRAMREDWTAERFAGAFQNTTWYRTHSEAYRQIYAQKIQDPATYQQNVGQQRAVIADTAGAMGVRLDAATLEKLTADSLAQGWTPAQLKNRLVAMINVIGGTDHFGGQAGDLEKALRQLVADYGQQMSDATLLRNVRAILSGDATVNDVQALLSEQAETLYPHLSDRLKKGHSLRMIADPYIEQMAYLLETDPGQITLQDPTIQGALSGALSKPKGEGQNAPGAMSMYEFQQQIRSDPRWARTKQAQDVTSAAMMKVLSDFGFMR